MKTFIDKLKGLLSGLAPFIAICFIIANFVVSCRVYQMSSPAEFHYYHESTNYVNGSSSYVVTNSTTSVSSISISGERASLSGHSVPREYTLPYQFLVSCGAPCIRYYGRYYYEGDQISLGRIYRIFPDRVYLQNGDVLINSVSAPGAPLGVSPLPQTRNKGIFEK